VHRSDVTRHRRAGVECVLELSDVAVRAIDLQADDLSGLVVVRAELIHRVTPLFEVSP